MEATPVDAFQKLAQAGIPIVFKEPSFEPRIARGCDMLRRIRKFGVDIERGPFVDIGCGWGRITLALLAEGFHGKYIGLDVMQNRIEWLQRNITPLRPDFTFHFTDVRNDRYNKEGGLARPQLAQFVPEPASTCLMLSVFTHMWEEDIVHYLREVRSVIAPNGVFVCTAFILREEAERAIAEGKGKYPMAFSRGPHCRYYDEAKPLLAVAYKHGFLDDIIRQSGFVPIYHFGRWSGASGQGGQDLVVATPA